ncbi:MAG: ABC transporter permease [Acidobacteria bacterium]|nr:ABC transporter permease [Acidobacteriota bacterium]MBV9475814.1 ABC transporter permease [Acidobacteriota bacterium]
MNGFGAVFRKELTQMMRDRVTIMFALAVPVFELILFGVIDMNAKNIPTVVFDQSKTQESRRLIEQFGATGLLRIIEMAPSRDELQHEIVAGHAQVGVEIPPDYARNLAAQRDAHVLVLIDGSDSSTASQALSAANGVVLQNDLQALLEQRNRARIEAHPVMLFNPDMRSANLLIPGLIAILLTFSGTILSAFAIVKERERGTLEQLMVTPVSPLAVVLGKILPYLGLAYVTLTVVLLLMRFLFRVPFNGSVVLLLSLSCVYLFALLSFGLLISSRAGSQMEAMQQAMGIMLPSVLLSGYVFPLASLPAPLRVVSYLLPATHFIKIARGIVIRGATFADLWEPVLSLLAISAVLIAASARAFKKTVS